MVEMAHVMGWLFVSHKYETFRWKIDTHFADTYIHTKKGIDGYSSFFLFLFFWSCFEPFAYDTSVLRLRPNYSLNSDQATPKQVIVGWPSHPYLLYFSSQWRNKVFFIQGSLVSSSFIAPKFICTPLISQQFYRECDDLHGV